MRQRTKRGQIRLHLSALHGGSFTRLWLCGAVPTALPPAVLGRLFAMLSFWSGWPVALALSVDEATASWCDVWSDALRDVPEHHLEIRFKSRRRPEVTGHER